MREQAFCGNSARYQRPVSDTSGWSAHPDSGGEEHGCRRVVRERSVFWYSGLSDESCGGPGLLSACRASAASGRVWLTDGEVSTAPLQRHFWLFLSFYYAFNITCSDSRPISIQLASNATPDSDFDVWALEQNGQYSLDCLLGAQRSCQRAVEARYDMIPGTSSNLLPFYQKKTTAVKLVTSKTKTISLLPVTCDVSSWVHGTLLRPSIYWKRRSVYQATSTCLPKLAVIAVTFSPSGLTWGNSSRASEVGHEIEFSTQSVDKFVEESRGPAAPGFAGMWAPATTRRMRTRGWPTKAGWCLASASRTLSCSNTFVAGEWQLQREIARYRMAAISLSCSVEQEVLHRQSKSAVWQSARPVTSGMEAALIWSTYVLNNWFYAGSNPTWCGLCG